MQDADSTRSISATLRDLMRMTSEGLDRLDIGIEKVRGELGNIRIRLERVEAEVQDLRQSSYRHELEIGRLSDVVGQTHDEQRNMHSDIAEIYDRLVAIEERLPPQQEVQVA